MTKIQCISPVDGSVYAERDYLNELDALTRIKRARNSQKTWAKAHDQSYCHVSLNSFTGI